MDKKYPPEERTYGNPQDLQQALPERAASTEDRTPLQVVLRHKWRILAFAVAATALAAAYVLRLPPSYVASTSVVVDTRQLRVIGGAESLQPSQSLDFGLLRTRAEELRSPQLLRAVVERLHLESDPEFCEAANPSPTWLERLGQLISDLTSRQPELSGGTAEPLQPCPISIEAAVKHLKGLVSADNDGRSYVIRIYATARKPELAAGIANAYAEAFVDRRREGRQQLTEQADVLLASQATELRQKMETTAAAVERYRSEHHLTSLRGETLVGQSLTELNSQLTKATSDLMQKQGTLRQLQELIRRDGNADSSTPILESPLIQRLQERHIQQLGALADLASRLGNAHPEVLGAAAQLERTRQQIRVEANKAATALSGEVAALEAREAALTAAVHDLQRKITEQGQADVQLRNLEREATLAKNLYETMATRLIQIRTEQGMQSADAYVAVEAQVPEKPSFPRTRMILAGVFLSSLGLGSGAAFAFSLASRVFRNSDEVEEQTGHRVLGMFPTPVRRSAPADMVVDAPSSLEAEALYAIMVTVTGSYFSRGAPQAKTIMVTSALPAEGKTSLSVALGRSAVRAGLSAIVVDCDLRHPAAEKLAVSPGRSGQKPEGSLAATDVQASALFTRPAIDPRSGLHVLSMTSPVHNPHEALATSRLPEILERLRSKYDLVIIDTPPILAVSDALNLAPLADEVLLVVSWRRAPRAAVSAALKALQRSGTYVSGVILTKVNLRRYARMAGSGAHYSKLYRNYHTSTTEARN